MTIYEDERTVSRADLAAWLRQLADGLESDGQIFYGAAGRLTVADQVHCELEIERESGSEVSVEIEFSWTDLGAAAAAAAAAAAGDDEEDGDEQGGQAEPTVGAAEGAGDAIAADKASGESEGERDKDA